MPSTFAQRLSELYEAHKALNPAVTQKQFARAFTKFMQANKDPNDRRKHTYSQQQISLYIQGKSKPDVDVIIGFADFFNVSPLYMAGAVDDPTVEVDDAKLTPEERFVLVQMRINEIFKITVVNLAKLSAGANTSGSLKEGEN